MRRYGADGDAVASAFERLVSAWADARSAPPSVCAFGHEREALRRSLDGFTALSFLDDTIYPHEQSQWDLAMLDTAIEDVWKGRWARARDRVGAVDLNGLAAILSRESFRVEQLHHDPGYENISWGGQGQLTEPIDLYAVFRQLDRASRGGAIDPVLWDAQLRNARRYARDVYRDRVSQVAATLDAVAAEIEAVRSCA
jgi:hypothetical protein